MNIVIGAIAGLAAGCIIGWLKNSLIWMKYLKKTDNENPAEAGVNGAYIRSMISFGVNVLTLAAAFFSERCCTISRYSIFNWHSSGTFCNEQGPVCTAEENIKEKGGR